MTGAVSEHQTNNVRAYKHKETDKWLTNVDSLNSP